MKSDTGLGPPGVERDQQGVSTELATGSGFGACKARSRSSYPSDLVVLYGNVSYLYNMPRDIDQQIGQCSSSAVDPGDSIGLGFGFGFAVNPRVSYSIGYSHSHVLPTESRAGHFHGPLDRAPSRHVQLGLSFRATERLTPATGVDTGVTQDAPDVRTCYGHPSGSTSRGAFGRLFVSRAAFLQHRLRAGPGADTAARFEGWPSGLRHRS